MERVLKCSLIDDKKKLYITLFFNIKIAMVSLLICNYIKKDFREHRQYRGNWYMPEWSEIKCESICRYIFKPHQHV